MYLTFSVFKLKKKCDTYQNGVEFCQKSNNAGAICPSPLLFSLPSLDWLAVLHESMEYSKSVIELHIARAILVFIMSVSSFLKLKA